MARTKHTVLNYQADDVWAAACAAQRINNAYIKADTYQYRSDDVQKTLESNKAIMDRFLLDTNLITQEDRNLGEQVRRYYKAYTFKILQGKVLGEFDNTAMLIANRDVIESKYDMAVIASLPSSYERAVKRDQSNRKLENANGGLLDKIGDKVKIKIEVVRNVFSKQYNVHIISGLTDDNRAVFFSYKQEITAGKSIEIQGTIKRHCDNITQLNRVKVI